jgi:hypothetical protein
MSRHHQAWVVVVGVVGDAGVERAVVDLGVQALVRRQHQLVALLDQRRVALEEDDVEVLARHGRDVALVVGDVGGGGRPAATRAVASSA